MNIEDVKEKLASGLSAEEVAISLGIDIDEVEQVVVAQREHQTEKLSNVEILTENLRILQKLVPTAQWTYESDPSVDNSTALTQLVSTLIHTIKEIEARKNPSFIMNEILLNVMQPVFRDLVRYVTLETGKARGSLEMAIPKQYHNLVDQTLKDIVKGTGRVLSSSYRDTVKSLADTLGCKAKDEKVAPILSLVSSDDEHKTKAAGQ